MQTVDVNITLDYDVKQSLEKVCSDMGLSMSALFIIFAKKVGREKRIPFEINDDPFYSANNIRHLEKIMQNIKDGKAHFAQHKLIEADEQEEIRRKKEAFAELLELRKKFAATQPKSFEEERYEAMAENYKF